MFLYVNFPVPLDGFWEVRTLSLYVPRGNWARWASSCGGGVLTLFCCVGLGSQQWEPLPTRQGSWGSFKWGLDPVRTWLYQAAPQRHHLFIAKKSSLPITHTWNKTSSLTWRALRPGRWWKQAASRCGKETARWGRVFRANRTGVSSANVPDHDFIRSMWHQEKMLCRTWIPSQGAFWGSPVCVCVCGVSHLVLVPIVITESLLGPKCFRA